MKGIIANFRIGRKTMYHNHMVVVVRDIKTRLDAAKLVGKEVVFVTPSKKQIKGKVASAHGNKGALRVIFEKAMPGQAIAQEVEIKAS